LKFVIHCVLKGIFSYKIQKFSDYIKLATELRKDYLKREMQNNKAMCLTIDKLVDLNDKFGSVTEAKFNIDTKPKAIRKHMVAMLSDPFLKTTKSISKSIQDFNIS